jgi:subtilisin family serine protease
MSPAAHRRSRRGRLASTAAAGFIGALTFCLGTPGTANAVASNARSSWNFQQVQITRNVQQAGHDGHGVVVAVVDTWVDGKGPWRDGNGHSVNEFGGRVLAGADCANRNGHCVAGPAPPDDCGHGTHVAGTIASTNWGVAPQATILPVRVLTDPDGKHADECTGSTDDVAAGITWADQHGARVINLSLAAVKGIGATRSPVSAAVQLAVQHGRVVVFAAGNNDRPVVDSYGGNALIVAATGPSGALASYSQRGSGVSVAAPGGDPRGSSCATSGNDCIVSTWTGGQYAALAGTSMSAPHVSGLAALLIGQQPTRSQADVVHAIQSTAHPLAGAGNGRIDAAAALGVTPSGTTTQHPATHAPAPTHRATAQSAPGTRKPPVQVQPSPKPSAQPLVTTAPSSSPTTVAAKHDGSGNDLPLAPPLISAVLLVGLASGWIAVWRRPGAASRVGR